LAHGITDYAGTLRGFLLARERTVEKFWALYSLIPSAGVLSESKHPVSHYEQSSARGRTRHPGTDGLNPTEP